MTVTVKPASPQHKEHLRKMLDQYLEELSFFGSFDQTYPAFDKYWQEQGRHPYLITADEEDIGFCFVLERSPFGREPDFFIAEFFILPEHRRDGHGANAAQRIFALHCGRWELSFFKTHDTARKFWLKSLQGFPFKESEHRDVTIFSFEIR